eukprot:TRINITY_DN3097_c0_g1_i1.p1 TRINITY_DN3097_c0_g1~~TRINITY_DN3097_c0_g1_i1.p1  ORF type:complete len:160 (-),score=29.85 TRINITY_DN3097_c0_g1_i1:10-489(-)
MDSLTGGPATWQWFDDYDWINYDNETSDLIEEGYQVGEYSIHLDHGYFARDRGFEIYYEEMVQENCATGNRRSIRRLDSNGTPLTNIPPNLEDLMNTMHPLKKQKKRRRKSKKKSSSKSCPHIRIDMSPSLREEIRRAEMLFQNTNEQQQIPVYDFSDI